MQGPLDPGTSTRRGSRSWCKCCLWTGFIFIAFLSVWMFFIIGSAFYRLISNIRSPHKEYYHNATQIPTERSVVRPLIDENQTFDIAVSVWARVTEAEEEAYEATKPANSVDVDVVEDSPFQWGSVSHLSDLDGKTYIASNVDLHKEDKDILETPLFSKIVFRGLRLKDKGISETVRFRLPTARFLGADLTPEDLRGSFVLIPSSPSPLDYLKNYSSWAPDTVAMYPLRTWPFPLGSLDHGERTLVDKAVDLFGFSIPLLEFHEVQSRCPNVSSFMENTTYGHIPHDPTTSQTKERDGNDDDDEDEDDDKSFSQVSIPQPSSTPVYKRHPYVVTRTQLRIVDETTLFNRTVYNKAHRELKSRACTLGLPNVKPRRRFCAREYKTNGHWETRLQLETPVPGNEDNVQTEWAYSPYLNHYKFAAGIQDLIPVPVTRENCTIAPNNSIAEVVLPKQDEEFMDITWRISFSGRSPAMMSIADGIGMLGVPRGRNQSDYQRVMAQDKAELLNGIVGHRFHDDSHPRRRVGLGTSVFLLDLINFILNLHYWYTRTSTVSISISGSMLFALSACSEHIIGAIIPMQELNKGAGFWTSVFFSFPTVLVTVIILLPQLAMVKAVMRLEWVANSGWMPRLRRVRANHQERASDRLDRCTSRTFRVALYTILVVTYYFFEPHLRLAIASHVPVPSPVDIKAHKLRDLSPIVVLPLRLSAIFQQLMLNQRTRAFAGQHKMSVLFACIQRALDCTIFVPAIVGRVDARLGLSIHTIVDTVLLVIFAWQAWILPSVPQTQGQEEDE